MIILNPIKKKESTDSFGKMVENISENECNYKNEVFPFKKKESNISIQSKDEFEKVVEKDEEEDNKFFEELINDIKKIPISQREKLKEYETDWTKIIEKKKFESKKKDVLNKIDVFMDLDDYKNPLTKIKKELEKDQITPGDANIKVLALKKINEYNLEKNPFV